VFFIWQGSGILVIGIPLFISLVLNLITNMLFGSHFYESSGFMAPLALTISAVFVYLMGIEANDEKHHRTVIDKETREEIKLIEKHTFFLIPMQYWSFVLGALAIYLLFFR